MKNIKSDTDVKDFFVLNKWAVSCLLQRAFGDYDLGEKLTV